MKEKTAFGGAAAIAVLMAAAIWAQASAKSDCLEAGYPQASIDFKLNKYCVKRVEQTGVVVPLVEARK